MWPANRSYRSIAVRRASQPPITHSLPSEINLPSASRRDAFDSTPLRLARVATISRPRC